MNDVFTGLPEGTRIVRHWDGSIMFRCGECNGRMASITPTDLANMTDKNGEQISKWCNDHRNKCASVGGEYAK